MKKIIFVVLVAMILTGCNEAPTATLEPEGEETIITERIITERIIEEENITTWDNVEVQTW